MTQDPYLDDNRVYLRLKSEYNKYKSLIVAVDFDLTLYDFHKEGFEFTKVIELIKACNRVGFKIIIFTANEEHSLIEKYCEDKNIIIEGININILPQFKGVKPYYNILLDDRAGLKTAYNILNKLIKEVTNDLD